MMFLEFNIAEDDLQRRLDRVARKILKEAPLSLLYKNIRSGFIRVNGVKVTNNYRLIEGDVLYVEKKLYETYFQQSIAEVISSNNNDFSYDTIFQNKHILVINKPSKINVQASTKNDISLDRIVKQKFCENLKNNSLSFLPGPLHRLDKNTTGLLVFSQSLKGAQYFSNAIANKKINKHYLCIFLGKINSQCTWEHNIHKNTNSKNTYDTVTVTKIEEKSDGAKRAKTIVIPLCNGTYFGEDITLAKVSIETGRTHQIRSQGAFCGHPLLGDNAYGYQGKEKDFYLHAWALEIPTDNPIGLPSLLIAEIPKSFKDFVTVHLSQDAIPSYN